MRTNQLLGGLLAVSVLAGCSTNGSPEQSITPSPRITTEASGAAPSITIVEAAATTAVGDSVVIVNIDELPAGIPTPTLEDSIVIKEGCKEGEDQGTLSIAKLGLTDKPVTCGDETFENISVIEGTPTADEYAANQSISQIALGHRTKHGGPFNQLHTLQNDDEIVRDGMIHKVLGSYEIPDSDYGKVVTQILNGTLAKYLGVDSVYVLMTCKNGTEDRTLVVTTRQSADS